MKSAKTMELLKAGKNPHTTAVALGLHASEMCARFNEDRLKTTGVGSCCVMPVNADGKSQ